MPTSCAWPPPTTHGRCRRAALAEALAESARWQPKALPITGHDVLALGVPAGPAVGELLAQVEDWWVEPDFAPDRAACLAKARALLATRARRYAVSLTSAGPLPIPKPSPWGIV